MHNAAAGAQTSDTQKKGMDCPMKIVNSLIYAFDILRHPFNGFWCLKSEKRGSVPASLILLGLFFVTLSMRLYGGGYVVRSLSAESFSVWMMGCLVLGLYLLFCVANWSLTTLMDGSGSFRDIVISTAYTLVPVLIANIPLFVLGFVLSQAELAFYNIISTASILWTVFLLLAANLSTHDYSMTKSIVTLVLTVIVMAVIVGLGVLFLNLLQQVWQFIQSVFREAAFRL